MITTICGYRQLLLIDEESAAADEQAELDRTRARLEQTVRDALAAGAITASEASTLLGADEEAAHRLADAICAEARKARTEAYRARPEPREEISSAGATVRIVAVDDHPVVGAGLERALSSEPRIEIIGTATTIEQAIELIDREQPDVVIADVVFPSGPRGIELVDRYGLVPDAPAILLYSNYAPPSMVALALEHGAAAYITKETWGADLIQAIRTVAAGGVFVSRQLLVAARAAPERPSPREAEIIEGIARGETNKEAAARLEIGTRTVETHLEHCFARYGVASRAELVALAMREHWLGEID